MWNRGGRVHFHLAEQKRNETAPFAFLATYTAGLGTHNKVRHDPIFLKDIPAFESSGIIVRVPDWWKAGRPSRPQVRAQVGDRPTAGNGNRRPGRLVSVSLE